MGADPWQQWQAFAASWGGPSGGAGRMGGAGVQGAAAFAAASELAERFRTAAQAFLDAAAAGAPSTEAARLFGDTLRDLFARLQPPWNVGGPASTPESASVLSTDVFAMGATREHQLRWQRLSQAWQQLDEAQRRLQRLWADALREAAADFAGRLGQPDAAPSPEAARHLYDTWIDCAEQAYARIAHGAPFCDALAESVNAGSRWRSELKAMVEHSAMLLDLPTRSELNTLHRRLRAVEAALREKEPPLDTQPSVEARRPSQTPAPPPAKTPKRRRAKS